MWLDECGTETVVGNTLDGFPHIQLVMSAVADAIRSDTYTNIIVVITKFIGLHRVPGMTRRTPLVSPANQMWYWIINVSREHRPMNAKMWEDAERNTGFAFLNTTNAKIGTNEMYGCQRL
jgi:hypothetical protein